MTGTDSEKKTWIKWNGGDCPVDRYAEIELRFRGTPCDIDRTKKPYRLRWDRAGLAGDIIEYRIIEGDGADQ